MNRKAAAFLGRHNFSVHQDIDTIVDAMLYDMDEGLSGRPSSEDMIRTYINAPKDSVRGKSVIVIDAGGTNFRSCLVSFDKDGNADISNLEKTKMPGVERQLTKQEFFDQMARNLEHLKDMSSRIGFCFSYPVRILEDGDGILLNFMKEVKAPEVEGCRVGHELLEALKAHGWKSDLKITLLNDTVAALLAGAATVGDGIRYSSYIGFILGTGMNAAYIQTEDARYPGLKTQIINCETGKFNGVCRSDFDIAFDKKSEKPGVAVMEKLCSGAYMGPLCYEVVTTAAREQLFSEKLCERFLSFKDLTQIEVDHFLHQPYSKETRLGVTMAELATQEDFDVLVNIFDALFERCARLASAILTACVVKSGAGKTPEEPVCILCNGTSFYKNYKVRQRVWGYLDQTLTNERGLYFDLVSRDNDITLGSAIGGLIK